MSSVYDPGGRIGKRSWPFPFVATAAERPISAGELTRTTTPGRMPPCPSLTVPMRAPVNPWAAIMPGSRTHPAARTNVTDRIMAGLRLPALHHPDVPGRLRGREVEIARLDVVGGRRSRCGPEA